MLPERVVTYSIDPDAERAGDLVEAMAKLLINIDDQRRREGENSETPVGCVEAVTTAKGGATDN